MTGAKLKEAHGQRRFLILKDGQMMELLYDLNAVMRHESEFELPLRGIMEDLHTRAMATALKADPEAKQSDIAAQVTRQIARELVDRRLAPGHIRELAQWAYALTETWREDKEIHLTWQQFRRLLHEPPPTGAATAKAKAKLELATNWMLAVAEVRAREEVDEEGNELAAGTEPDAPSAPKTPLTGTDSGISSPSKPIEPPESSGEPPPHRSLPSIG